MQVSCETYSESSDGDNPPSPPPPTRKAKGNTRKTNANQTRFRWTSEMVECIIQCIIEMKTQYEFKGLDSEADVVKLYKEVQSMMAGRYESGDFGPVNAVEIRMDITTEELAKKKSAT